MPGTPTKVWGSTVTFNGNPIGRVREIGSATRQRNIIEFLTCDSTTEDMESISSGKNPGELSLTLIYEKEASANYDQLKDDFDADTSATLTIAYGSANGSEGVTARVSSLSTPRGAAEGGMFEFDVTFKRSGTDTFTPAA